MEKTSMSQIDEHRSSEYNHFNIYLGHTIKFLIGLSLGCLYIVGYIITVGSNFHFDADNFALSLAALAFCFIIEYFLEISSGYRADKFGEKLTIFMSMLIRSLFFVCLAISVTFYSPSPVQYSFFVFLAYFFYAVSYTLLSGNFEEWMQKQCGGKLSLKVFSVNHALFKVGLTLGFAFVIFLPFAETYSQLQYFAIPIYLFSISSCLLIICLSFFMRETKGFTFAELCQFLQSYFQFKNKNAEKTKKDIQEVRVELKNFPFLNQIYWIEAGRFTVELCLLTLIPIYIFSSDDFDLKQKFIIILASFILPNIFGALLRKKQEGLSDEKVNRALGLDVITYFAITALVGVVSLLPIKHSGSWYTDPLFLSFITILFIQQLTAGRVIPFLMSYKAKLSNESSRLPKTLLSIGERRQKFGSIAGLLLTSLGAFFPYKEAYLMIISLMSLLCLVYSFKVFKNYLNAKKREYKPV